MTLVADYILAQQKTGAGGKVRFAVLVFLRKCYYFNFLCNSSPIELIHTICILNDSIFDIFDF